MATAPIRERKFPPEPLPRSSRGARIFDIGMKITSAVAIGSVSIAALSWLSIQQEPLVVSAPKPQPVRREVVLADRLLAETIEALRRTVPAAKSVRVCGDSTGRFIATIWGLPEQDLLLGTGSSMHAAVADLDARRKRLMMGLAGYLPPDQSEH